MGYNPRIPTTFESAGGGTVFTFPVYEYAWQTDQGLYTSSVPVVGANYPYDQLGTGRPIKQAAREQLRFMVYETDPATVDSDMDSMLSKLLSIGQGKLYVTDRNSVKRWAYARVIAMPTVSWAAGDIFLKSCQLEYQRPSDWYGTTGYNTDFTIDADPKSITIVNAGNERIYNAILTLKGTYSSSWTILNTTNGYQVQCTQAGAAASDWLKIDAGQHSVKFSGDSGATYVGKYSTVTLPTTQIALVVLEPGNNAFTVTGANGSTLHVDFYAAYA